MSQTIVEKIFSLKSGRDCKQGEIIVAKPDLLFATDTNGPTVIDAFEKLVFKNVYNKEKISIVLDHFSPPPNETAARIHQKLRKFAKEQEIKVVEVGSGVCHQVNIESGEVLPGRLILGSDSHSLTYGALNAMGLGVGSTDMAIAWATGELWFKVPETIKVIIKGKVPFYIDGKDLALVCLKELGSSGATYKSIEFTGEAVKYINMDSRFTICNMATEMGAKTCFFPCDDITEKWISENIGAVKYNSVEADEGASYCKEIHIDASNLTPLAAVPHNVDNIEKVADLTSIRVDQVLIGSCTNGRLSDYKIAADVLKGRRAHHRVRLIVFPASHKVYANICREGILQTLVDAGAIVVPPTCGPCAGYHGGIPGDSEVVASTTNRNFKGRMGNSNAEIYLVSPLTAAVAAVEGEFVDPVKWLEVNEVVFER